METGLNQITPLSFKRCCLRILSYRGNVKHIWCLKALSGLPPEANKPGSVFNSYLTILLWRGATQIFSHPFLEEVEVPASWRDVPPAYEHRLQREPQYNSIPGMRTFLPLLPLGMQRSHHTKCNSFLAGKKKKNPEQLQDNSWAPLSPLAFRRHVWEMCEASLAAH